MTYLSTSREQDLAATPRHQALLKALGVASPDAYSEALHHHLRASGNTHASDPGENVGVQIRRSTGSEELLRGTPGARKRGQRKTGEEVELERMSRERASGGIDDHAGCSLSKSINAGSFERMRARFQSSPSAMQKAVRIGSDDQMAAATLDVLRSIYATRSATLAKSVVHDNGDFDSFESRYGIGVAQAVGVKTIAATIKPSAPAKPTFVTIRKSLDKVGSLMKSMGLEVSYDSDSDSATLTGGDAIREHSLAGAKRKPKYSAEQILKAASAALHAGAISGSDAQAIQHQVNLRGTCDDELIKKLTGEDSDDVLDRLDEYQVRSACVKGMQTGAVTPAEAMHCDVALSLNQPIDGALTSRLCQVHCSK